MRLVRRSLPILALLLSPAGCGPETGAETPPVAREERHASAPEPDWKSPRIAALAAALKAGESDAIERFRREVEGKAPLVEPKPDDDGRVWVTFAWRGDDHTQGVDLFGGLPAPLLRKPMARVAGSDLWALTEDMPRDSRFEYAFVVVSEGRSSDGTTRDADPAPAGAVDPIEEGGPPSEARVESDPWNPKSRPSRSVAELPDAPMQEWLEPRPENARGELAPAVVPSAILGNERRVSIYIPSCPRPPGGSYPLLVVLDGASYSSRSGTTPAIPLPTILDNLIAAGAIRPAIAVLVESPSQDARNRQLACSEPFADFLTEELVPWVRERFPVADDPGEVVVAGSSLGGLCAAFCALRHPEVFGNVLAQSGSFWYYAGYPDSPFTFETETGWLTNRYATEPPRPLRFYLEVGRFERWFLSDNLAENRRFRDVLTAKGYPVTYREYDGGHEYTNWRGGIAEGLKALLGPH